MSGTILIENHGGWTEIVLNRPDRRNAFNAEMLSAFRSALTAACEDDECRVILITGAGKAFSAGQDLSERDASKIAEMPDLSRTVAENYHPLVRLIRNAQKPVIAAVNGAAAGAGDNIALTCDIVLASEQAVFIQAFSKLGLVPDAGGAWLLSQLLGPARAKGLVLTAEPIGAKQAVDWGLIYKTYPEESLLAEARALAAQFAKGPTIGYALTKQLIQEAGELSYEALLTREAEFQGRAGRTPDYAEGVKAFFEKRPPQFTGRE